jgi:hypothetical protein
MSGDLMAYGDNGFERSILRQIALNRSRTPTQRFLVICDLLDTARAMAPMDSASQQRRLRVEAARQRRKQFLTVHRPIVTVDRTNVSFRIEGNQMVERFPFLILKTPSLSTPPPRHQVSAVGGGVAAPVA